jgi:AcrR family transcriptional regulator
MPKGSPELTAARKSEIMEACRALYARMNFKDITLKEIGNVTSFTRTSIYNYFRSKEEIFLALFEKEYRDWTDDLTEILESPDVMDKDGLAKMLAETLNKRELMLRLLSANLYDLEENSRMERLVDFKRAYKVSVEFMEKILLKCFPNLNEHERRLTLVTVLEFLHGAYPYAHATEKQAEAMSEAGVPKWNYTLYELLYEGLRRILC